MNGAPRHAPAVHPPGASRTLGVCIPTYKRPDQLVRCVRSIIESARPHAVPIFISDDATDDTNAAAVAALRAEYEYVVYDRNPVNLGIDGNIVKSISMCSCRYAWPMGEDDRMRPGGVAAVLAAVGGAEPPDFVYVNYAAVDADVSTILKERSLPIRSDAAFAAADFVARGAWSIGFIGACVIATERWRAVDPRRYVGTYFAHVGTILEGLAGGGRVHAIAEPQVLNRGNAPSDFTWAAQTFEVFVGWERMVRLLAGHYPGPVLDACVDSFAAATRFNTLRFLCYARAGNVYDRRAYAQYVRPRARSRAFRAGAWAVASVDHRLFRSLKRGWDAVRRLRQRAVAEA